MRVICRHDYSFTCLQRINFIINGNFTFAIESSNYSITFWLVSADTLETMKDFNSLVFSYIRSSRQILNAHEVLSKRVTELEAENAALREKIDSLPNRQEEIAEAAEIHLKYKGYIERERQVAEKMHRLENIKIKGKFDYPNLTAISTEARQKLERIQPVTLAQASRIPGVSPSDINAMLVLLGR